MAYLPESEQDRQKRMQTQGQAGPQVASGPSGVISGNQNSQPAAQAGQPGAPTRSGSYTNLNSYLQANKPQAAELGQKVADNVSNKAEEVKSQVGQLQSTFQQKADQGSVQRDQQFVNDTVNNASLAVKNQDQVNRFAQMRDAQYKGPQSVQDIDGYTDAQQKVTNVGQAVENTKSEAGRFSLVQDQFAKPSYNRGQQRLDQMLLQNSDDARASLNNVREQYGGIKDTLTNAQTQSAQYAAQKKKETDAARQDVMGALGQVDDPTTAVDESAGAYGDLYKDLSGRTDNYKQTQQGLYDRIMSQIGGTGDISNRMGMSEFDADTLAALGLSDGQKLYNTDLSQFAPQFNADAVNMQNVANADDYSRYSALNQLSGRDASLLYDPKQAGTAKGVTADSARLQETLANKEAQYNELTGDRMKGLSNDMLTFLRSRQSLSLNPVQAGNMSPEAVQQYMADVRNQMSNYSDYTKQDLALWDQGQFNAQDQSAVAYRNINNWLNDYNTLTPNRVATKKG